MGQSGPDLTLDAVRQRADQLGAGQVPAPTAGFYRAVAFMDLNPVTPGHVLVVPRLHAAGLEDLDEDTSAHVWQTVHRMGRALRRSGLRCEGVNVFLADGAVAFQEIFHFHLHVFARFRGDTFRIDADWATRDRHLHDDATPTLPISCGHARRPDSSFVTRAGGGPSRGRREARGAGAAGHCLSMSV
jgi:histidine triad (HIT) family protein